MGTSGGQKYNLRLSLNSFYFDKEILALFCCNNAGDNPALVAIVRFKKSEM